MAFCRFNYDKARTIKKLQESTGPGRYVLDVPGWGDTPCYYDDPQIRLQKWGANLESVINGAPIDIDSDLSGRTRQLKKYISKKDVTKQNYHTEKKNYPVCDNAITDQSRVTHPAWQYRALPQNREYPLFLDPQENVCLHFHNNINTRLLERDNFIPKIPCLKK
jgi:hypothetical protein